MTVYIIFSVAGSDTGPFNLYSDVDGYSSPFESGISKAALLSGYTSTAVPLGTSIIRAISEGICSNYLDMSIITTTSTSTTSFPPTTTTTTTITCTYLAIDVVLADLQDATGNSSYPDGTLYVEYRDCTNSLIIDTFDTPDVSSGTSSCWNGGSVHLYYYKNDVQTDAEFSSIINEGPCSP